MKSNSHFLNPTFEEPSPGKIHGAGPYHSNLIGHGTNSLPPNLPRLAGPMMTTSSSHPMFKAGNSTTSTQAFVDRNPMRDSAQHPTPKNYNFAINDQISMFSSQDKRPPKSVNMNASDIVEYNYDMGYQRMRMSNNADTLERDFTPFRQRNQGFTARTDPIAHQFHSFQPEQPMKEDLQHNEEIDNEKINAEEAFSFDKKNLFSIEDLNSNVNQPLRELQEQNALQKSKSTDGKAIHKIKPLNLPRTTNNAQKHKGLLNETKKFNFNRISADSPQRTLAATSKVGDAKSVISKDDIDQEEM